MMRAWFVPFLALALVALVALGTPVASAAEHDHDMGAMIGTAKSKADHERIATMFETEAAEARAQSEKHKKMADAYRKSGNPAIVAKSGLVEHCETLAKSFATAAEEYAALAKMHREMAGQAN